MKYYRVKPENDNNSRFRIKRGGGLYIDGCYIKNELYTSKEIARYLGGIKECEVVEIPKSKIYFFFGARFAIEEA